MVYSDKLATAELAALLPASTAKDRGLDLLMAAASVLLQYSGNAEELPMGVAQGGSVVALSLSITPQLRYRELADSLQRFLNQLSLEPFDFDKQVTEAGLGSVTNRNPFFGLLVVLDQAAIPPVRQDVTLHFDHLTNCIVATYSARLFRQEIVENFLIHVRQALIGIKTNASATILGTSCIDDEEHDSLRALGFGGQPACHSTIEHYLSEALILRGNQTALEYLQQSWTLADLVRRADQIISNLGSSIKKGSRLGIALHPGPDQIAALLAAIRTGAIIVPLDTTLPSARQAAIRADANLTAIVTEKSLVAHFFESNPLVVEALPADHNEVQYWPTDLSDPDSPLYLLFTSGSTGRPKGVLVPQRTLANLIAWEDRQRPTMGKRTLGRTSIAFDVGLQEVFATILFGGVLVVATDSERADIGTLANLLSEYRISRVYLPPVALHQMAESSEAEIIGLETLENVIVAGEQLRISQPIRRFFRKTHSKLINQYGPTETHVVTEAVLDDAPLRWPDLPSIGRPIAGVNALILDANGNPTPKLVAGELVIGGIAPALRYVGQPEITHARFISDIREGRLYRTGDRARWRLDGNLEFLGRMDDQVKIRGYRVELTDLEVNATSLPGVCQAVAKFWSSETWSGLALYLRLDNKKAPSLRKLRDALRETVPEYMLPPRHAIFAIEEFPLLNSGKVDRSRLPEPCLPDPVSSDPLDVYGRVRDIWSKRLGLRQLDSDEDFLDLGGHSLLAIQIVSEVNDTFKVGVPLSTLLRGISLLNFTALVKEHIALRVPQSDGALKIPLEEPQSSPAAEGGLKKYANAVLPSGSFLTLSPSETRHLWREIYDQCAYRPDVIKYETGATIIDVGANVGVFSRYALDAIEGCRLIAIEPAAELFHCLQSNLAQCDNNVTLFRFGCGREDSNAVSFSFFPLVPAMSSFRPDLARDRGLLEKLLANDSVWSAANDLLQRERFLESAFVAELQKCPTRRLSSLFSELNLTHVNLLKIDVQRGEDDVLAGVSDADWPKIQQVVIELQDQNGAVANILTFLQSRGFSVKVATIPLHLGTDVRFIYSWRS
jgi:amino acid adenylation domain-containing protein/FkbM family methyltransferase